MNQLINSWLDEQMNEGVNNWMYEWMNGQAMVKIQEKILKWIAIPAAALFRS